MDDSAQPATTASIMGEVLVYVGALFLMLGVGTLYFDHRHYAGGANTPLGAVLTFLGVIGLAIASTQHKAISADLDIDIAGDQEPPSGRWRYRSPELVGAATVEPVRSQHWPSSLHS
jgi:hypothetical protein